MPFYHDPGDIAGYPRKEGFAKALNREMVWFLVAGSLAGIAGLAADQGAWGFIGLLLFTIGLGFGGWLAEAIFYHHVAVRMPDPFSPAAYLARGGLWAGLGGISGWLGQASAALLEGKTFPGLSWLIAGAVISVLVQAPIRQRMRRKADRSRRIRGKRR